MHSSELEENGILHQRNQENEQTYENIYMLFFVCNFFYFGGFFLRYINRSLFDICRYFFFNVQYYSIPMDSIIYKINVTCNYYNICKFLRYWNNLCFNPSFLLLYQRLHFINQENIHFNERSNDNNDRRNH